MTYQHQIDRAEATLGRIAANVERTEGLLTEIRNLLAASPVAHPTVPSPGTHLLAAFPPATAMPPPPARPAGSLKSVNDLPDRAANPGATNPDVTQENMATTIFVSGYTATIRPPVAFTNALKRQQLIEYGYPPDTDPSLFEEDHIVPLECGGAPHDAANLWPQLRTGQWGARCKDLTENAANAALRAGTHTLQEIQDGFCRDWKALHTELFSNPQVVGAMMAMAMAPKSEEP